MPELPEVETVKNLLIPIVKNKTIKTIEVKRESIIEGDASTFVSALVNETFLDIKRIGKYLIFILTNEKVIISHLRMEGKFYSFKEDEEDSKYARVVFYLNEKEISKLGRENFVS